MDRAGTKLVDKALPNDEGRLREIMTSLVRHGRTLLVVDQPATIGALFKETAGMRPPRSSKGLKSCSSVKSGRSEDVDSDG